VSRVNISNRVPRQYDPQTFADILRDLEKQINAVSEGKRHGTYNAHTAAPTGTAQSYEWGDFVKNSKPAEAGTAGSKYVIVGWLNSAAGSPGTWLECRFLTGN